MIFSCGQFINRNAKHNLHQFRGGILCSRREPQPVQHALVGELCQQVEDGDERAHTSVGQLAIIFSSTHVLLGGDELASAC